MKKTRAISLKNSCAQFNCNLFLLAICLASYLPLAYAQAPVVDDSDNFAIIEEQQAAIQSPANQKYAFDSRGTHNNYHDDETPLAVDDGNTSNADSSPSTLEEKVQSLQKELRELRGQMEVQMHELKQLKQQQLAFYKDLDARIQGPASVSKAPPANAVSAPIVSPSAAALPATPPAIIGTKPNIASAPSGIPGKQTPYVKPENASPPVAMSEQKQYLAAYELVKNKRYDKALSAMHEFVAAHPKGIYTGNAHYWLGELYMVKSDHSKAIEQFAVVINQFPDSSKVSASILKMGYALAASGRVVEARQRLEQVIQNYPGTTAAQLAMVKLDALQLS